MTLPKGPGTGMAAQRIGGEIACKCDRHVERPAHMAFWRGFEILRLQGCARQVDAACI